LPRHGSSILSLLIQSGWALRLRSTVAPIRVARRSNRRPPLLLLLDGRKTRAVMVFSPFFPRRTLEHPLWSRKPPGSLPDFINLRPSQVHSRRRLLCLIFPCWGNSPRKLSGDPRLRRTPAHLGFRRFLKRYPYVAKPGDRRGTLTALPFCYHAPVKLMAGSQHHPFPGTFLFPPPPENSLGALFLSFFPQPTLRESEGFGIPIVSFPDLN